MKKILLLIFITINSLAMNNEGINHENQYAIYDFHCSQKHRITSNDRSLFLLDFYENHRHSADDLKAISKYLSTFTHRNERNNTLNTPIKTEEQTNEFRYNLKCSLGHIITASNRLEFSEKFSHHMHNPADLPALAEYYYRSGEYAANPIPSIKIEVDENNNTDLNRLQTQSPRETTFSIPPSNNNSGRPFYQFKCSQDHIISSNTWSEFIEEFFNHHRHNPIDLKNFAKNSGNLKEESHDNEALENSYSTDTHNTVNAVSPTISNRRTLKNTNFYFVELDADRENAEDTNKFFYQKEITNNSNTEEQQTEPIVTNANDDERSVALRARTHELNCCVNRQFRTSTFNELKMELREHAKDYHKTDPNYAEVKIKEYEARLKKDLRVICPLCPANTYMNLNIFLVYTLHDARELLKRNHHRHHHKDKIEQLNKDFELYNGLENYKKYIQDTKSSPITNTVPANAIENETSDDNAIPQTVTSNANHSAPTIIKNQMQVWEKRTHKIMCCPNNTIEDSRLSDLKSKLTKHCNQAHKDEPEAPTKKLDEYKKALIEDLKPICPELNCSLNSEPCYTVKDVAVKLRAHYFKFHKTKVLPAVTQDNFKSYIDHLENAVSANNQQTHENNTLLSATDFSTMTDEEKLKVIIARKHQLLCCQKKPFENVRFQGLQTHFKNHCNKNHQNDDKFFDNKITEYKNKLINIVDLKPICPEPSCTNVEIKLCYCTGDIRDALSKHYETQHKKKLKTFQQDFQQNILKYIDTSKSASNKKRKASQNETRVNKKRKTDKIQDLDNESLEDTDYSEYSDDDENTTTTTTTTTTTSNTQTAIPKKTASKQKNKKKSNSSDEYEEADSQEE